MTTEALLPPTGGPITLIDADGHVADSDQLKLPDEQTLVALHRAMVIGRRFDAQATALTKQGRLAVYPSSRGQEACQVAAAQVLREQDWLFPTYRDSVSLISRGLSPIEVLTLLAGDWHCGYDPMQRRTAPQCTPLATNALHAVGVGHAARLRGDDSVSLVLIGDGATSEGDAHEALNFAGVWKAPVIFLIQNNGYAISVPLSKQTAAGSLAYKGIGYGVPSLIVDGNDAAAVYAALEVARDRAVAGEGPTLIEAMTYRMEAHTNADDAARYREQSEVDAWIGRDPIDRLRTYLTDRGLLDDEALVEVQAEAEQLAALTRESLNAERQIDPADIFDHVYTSPRPTLRAQRSMVLEGLRAI